VPYANTSVQNVRWICRAKRVISTKMLGLAAEKGDNRSRYAGIMLGETIGRLSSVACALNLQRLRDALEDAWAFSVALETSIVQSQGLRMWASEFVRRGSLLNTIRSQYPQGAACRRGHV
jgi:hypothetical protein